jgi:SpoVK/Ycf46/Vps4 family AAA+-type ATPase
MLPYTDILLLCKEAAMRPVRKLMNKLSSTIVADGDNGNGNNAASIDSRIKIDPVTMNDVYAALKCCKPSANLPFLQKYVDWQSQYGSEYSSELAIDHV